MYTCLHTYVCVYTHTHKHTHCIHTYIISAMDSKFIQKQYNTECLKKLKISSCFENKTGLKQGDCLSSILALQQVIQGIQMVPSGIKIGKEQLNVLAYAVLVGKNEIEIRQLFVET